MRVKLLVLASFSLLVIVVGLFLIIRHLEKNNNGQMDTSSQKSAESNGWAQIYVSTHPFNPSTLEGAQLSQAFTNQVWFFGKLSSLNLNNGQGTLIVNANNSEYTFSVSTKTNYLFSDITAGALREIRSSELRPDDSLQVTLEKPAVGSSLYEAVTILKI